MAQNYEYHTKQKAVLLIFKTKRPNTQMGYVILRSKLQPVPLHFFYKIFISNRKKKNRAVARIHNLHWRKYYYKNQVKNRM